MRILVLRPEPDAWRSAAALRSLGHVPVVAPLFVVRPTGHPCPDGPFDAVLLTSANAIAPLKASLQPVPATVPVLVIGARSAAAAREAGFSDVQAASGTRHDLIGLATRRLPRGSRILLALGRDHKADLAPSLQRAGLHPVAWLAYEAEAVPDLPDAVARELQAGTDAAVLHYSRRGAETLLALADHPGFRAGLLGLAHVVLSPDVAAPLLAAGATRVLVAEQPDERSLLAKLSGISTRNPPAEGDNLAMATDENSVLETGPPTGDSMGAGENKRAGSPEGPAATTVGKAGRGQRQAIVIEGDIVRTPDPGPEAGPEHVGPGVPHVEAPATGSHDAASALATEASTAAASAEAVPAATDAPVAGKGNTGRPVTVAVLAAGLLGGFIGAGLAFVVPNFIRSLDGAAGQGAAFEARLKALQDTVVPRQTVEALDARVREIGSVATQTQADAASTARRLADLLASAPGAADAAGLATIAERARRAEALAAAATEKATAREKQLDEAAGRISELSARLSTLEQTARSAGIKGNAADAATRLVLAARISQSLDAGTPFAGDLRALTGSGTGPGQIDQSRLAPLLAVAEKGAASREALQAAFRRLRPTLEQDTAVQSTSLGDRFLKAMEGVVSIRPIGEQGGTSPMALAARLDRALANGDIMAAANAWKQLPEPARRASEGFGASLGARAAAQQAIRQVDDETIATLGATR